MLNQLVDKETTSKLLTEMYSDLAKPAVTEVGIALGTIFGLCNTLLMVITFQNEKAKLKLQHNLEIYRQKIEKIKKENIQEVIPEIGIPVVEKLLYVTDDTLVDLYTELLAKASDKTQCDLAHPSFVNIINNLSPKEARILEYIKRKIRLAVVDISILTDGKSKPFETLSELILLDDYYDANIKAYLSNLIGLGLLISDKAIFQNQDVYESIEAKIIQTYSKGIICEEGDNLLSNARKGNIEFKRYSYKITEFGDLFISSCTQARPITNFFDLFSRACKLNDEDFQKLNSHFNY